MAYHYKESIEIIGLKIRTTSQQEVTNEGKVTPLWDIFHAEILPQLEEGCELYSACHYHDQLVSAELEIVVGARAQDMQKGLIDTDHPLSSSIIDEGGFLSFAVIGERPNAVLRAWQQARQYFNEDDTPCERAFTTDYVHYFGDKRATLYVSVIAKKV